MWQYSTVPFFDCVAMNVTSGELLTSECTRKELPFMCVNDGFSTEPIEHFACPKDWLFSHHLSDPYGCIQVFSPASYNSSLQTCENHGATLIKAKDFHGIYYLLQDGYLSEFTSKAYWVNEPLIKSAICEVRAKIAPPKKMNWKTYSCSHHLPFICKQDLKKIDVFAWIAPKEILPFVSTAVHNRSLACSFSIHSKKLDSPVSQSFLKYLWFKNGIPVSQEPILDFANNNDGLRLSGEFVNLQGDYQCSLEILGIKESFSSNVEHIFHSDVSSYILTGNITNDSFTDYPSFQNFIREFFKHPIWNDLKQSIPASSSLIDLAIRNVSVQSFYIILKMSLCFKWTSIDKRLETEDLKLYHYLERLFLSLRIGSQAWAVQRADVCSSEESETDAKTFHWPESFAMRHAVSEPLCLTGEGTAVYRKCFGDFRVGAHWGPEIGHCDKISSNITSHLYKLTKVPVTPENAFFSAQTLAEIVSTSENLISVDLQFIASKLDGIANSSIANQEIVELAASTIQNVMNINQTILSATQMRMNTSSRIVESFERIVSESVINGTNLTFASDDIAVAVWQLNLTNEAPIGAFATFKKDDPDIFTIFNSSALPLDNYDAGIIIPFNLVAERSGKSARSRLQFIFYKTSSLFQENKRTDNQTKAISPIVHASLGLESVWDLDPPVYIYFKDLKKGNVSYSGNIACGFWDQTLNDKFGAWSEEGCALVTHERGDQICQCNHLTNLGALMNLNLEDFPEHKLYLSLISLIGCSLSVFGLAMTILTFLLFRKWRRRKKHQIIVNLSVALISVLIIFLVGFYETEHEIGCMAVAILLHYFMLATFAWMLVEAIFQYLHLVKVYNAYIPRFMTKALVLAWGTPLLIICIVLIVDYKLYIRNKGYCWLTDDAFFYAFVLPSLALLLTNFVLFSLILYSITCGRDTSLRNNQDERKVALMRFRAAVCSYFLLGLSWLFGFIAIDGVQLLFQYLFAITTTLQGFLIFVFFIAQEKAAQDMWTDFLFSKLLSNQKSNVSYSAGTVNMHIRK